MRFIPSGHATIFVEYIYSWLSLIYRYVFGCNYHFCFILLIANKISPKFKYCFYLQKKLKTVEITEKMI